MKNMENTESLKKALRDSLSKIRTPDLLRKGISSRTSLHSLCQETAKWLDREVAYRRLVPDIHGNYVFAVRYVDFLTFIGRTQINQGFRRIMKDYGYKLHRYKRELQITKFLQ